MSEIPQVNEMGGIPEAVPATKSRRSVQVVWLIPLIAILIGGWLAVKSILEKGPTITIAFKNAEGLDDLVAFVREQHPELEVEVHDGGQPHYPLLFGAE